MPREKSLEQIKSNLIEANATIALAQSQIDLEHPAWLTLDGYDGSMDNVRELLTSLHPRDEAVKTILKVLSTSEPYKTDGTGYYLARAIYDALFPAYSTEDGEEALS